MSQAMRGKRSNNDPDQNNNSSVGINTIGSNSVEGSLASYTSGEHQQQQQQLATSNNTNIGGNKSSSSSLKELDSDRRPLSTSSTSSSSTISTPAGGLSGGEGGTGSQQQRMQLMRDSGHTSNSHRLSSIEILNENRQRQLQFKQQESFKLHIEQRQKLIQQQQRESNDQSNLGLTYQVNTNAPDFMASAIASSKAPDEPTGNEGTTGQRRVASASGLVNPFNRDNSLESGRAGAQKAVAGSIKRPTSAPGGDDKKAASTVSGKDGFLSALMDEASFDSGSNQLDRSQEELNVRRSEGEPTRYANVTAERDFNYYEANPDKRPFYEKDIPTLLQECRGSRKLVIAIVAIALLLDNMLLTSVVPIIPFDLLKNKLERKHNELLRQRQFNKSIQLAKSKGQQNGDDTDDDDDDEQMAKFIDQSIANAKDRYSGSVFHPKVISRPSKQQQPEDQDDDGDEDEQNDNADDDRKGSGSDRWVGRRPPSGGSETRKMQSTPRQSIADDYEPASRPDDGDEDADEDGPPTTPASTTTTKPVGGRKMKQKQTTKIPKQTGIKSAGGQKNKQMSLIAGGKDDDLGDDDDDEEAASSRRWLKLKSSLVAMARRGGNDTDALADMCLSSVLGKKPDGSLMQSDAPMEDDDEEEDNDDDQQEIQKEKIANTEGSKVGPRRSRRSVRPEKNKPKLIRPTPKPADRNTEKQPNNDQAEADDKTSDEPENGVLDDMSMVSHQDIVDESFEVGVMFASKPIVQAFANPFIGTLTNRVGFTIPMFTGFVIMFISTLVFAFGSSYSTLFIARAIQGVGSACTSVAGMSMLADRFPDDAERGNAMAIALGGLALGVVIGPPFGGFMYQFVGRSSPFIVLSILALLDGLLQLLVLQPRVTKSHEEGASLMTLIKDPYILVAAGAITFANTGIAILEPALPLWMMDTMQAKNWEQGVAFLPAALSYLFGTNLFGNLGHKIGRWRSTMLGLIIIGCSLLLIPFATRVEHLIVPNGAIGFAMGMVDSTMMPMLGYLVDIRHTSVYGSVYAIGDVAFCASFAFGPALSGTLVELIGFEGLIITTAMICFCFAPLLLLLRNPPPRQLNEAQLLEQSTLRYVNYNQLDSPDEEAHLTEYKRSSEKNYVR